MATDARPVAPRPGKGMDTHTMPGHWLLARLGKRVLRPGGLELTCRMLDALAIEESDAVVEFAPGLGVTARRVLDSNPASYTAIERDKNAAQTVRTYLSHPEHRCLVGGAEATGLGDECATVVYGEAMLSMQLPSLKVRIVREAARLLKPQGRYGIHELVLTPDDLDYAVRQEIGEAMSRAISHGVRVLTASEWVNLLESEGFDVQARVTAGMHLLEPRRIVADEGLGGALRFAWNVLRDREARKRVLLMRGVFRKYRDHLTAIMMVGVKRG